MPVSSLHTKPLSTATLNHSTYVSYANNNTRNTMKLGESEHMAAASCCYGVNLKVIQLCKTQGKLASCKA